MKKIAISALVLSMIGMAHAEVNVYGKFAEYQESYTLGTASSLTRMTNDSSRLGVKASEKVDNDITVGGVFETGIAIDAPSATTLGDRTAILSLSNSLGTLSAGRDKHAIARVLDNFDAMENAYSTIVNSIHYAQGTRVQNAIFLTTAPVAGFSASYQFANSEVAGTANSQAGGINYSSGPFSAAFARYDNGTTTFSNIVGLKYKLEKTDTTLYGLYSDDTIASVNTIGKSIGVRQVVTPQLALLASYGEKNDGTTGTAVGAAYAMNKALTFHARYAKIDTTTDITQYGVGVQYNF